MLLQWLTRISLVIIVFVIWYPISRHFLRTVLFWHNKCIYDYHNYVRMKTKGNFKISSTICLHLPMLQMQSIVSSLNESYTLVCTTSY